MKKIVLKALVILVPLVSLKASATPPTITTAQFVLGATWVWSYSEWNPEDQVFFTPYLYEKYEVVEVNKNVITIEMSSGSRIDHNNSPHHKFSIDIDRCLKLGQSTKSLRGLKIHFYTKSLEQDWQLLSKNHKALAFTEKFNCLSVPVAPNIDLNKYQEQSLATFQWPDFTPTSWYAFNQDPSLQGVMIKRNAKNILVRLVEAID